MKAGKILLIFICVMFSCDFISSLNILAVMPYQGKSHFFVFEPYLHELARRGHNLTVISYFPQQKVMKNYHDISLAGKTKIIENFMPLQTSYWAAMQLVLFSLGMGVENCRVMLADKNVQHLWNSKVKFDLVVMEQFNSDCALGLAHKLGAPTIGLTSHVLLPSHYEQLGIPYNPSYVPFPLLGGGNKPSLYERIERSIFHLLVTHIYEYMSIRPDQNTLQEYFDNMPPLMDLARDRKFTLLYTNFVLTGSRLFPPNVIEVGGYHIAKPKTLPKELKKFIEESKHGVIYISFGSMLKPDLTPLDKVKAIVDAISKIPQRVVWKWDASLPKKPKNVYLAKWLPQNDILAHPNVLAFYSHCGMLSTTEAIYHGVPMIGMPIFADQPANAAAIEEIGLGVQIHFTDVTEKNLLLKIKTVLNPEFRRKVKELSKIWHDRPMTPMDTAIYWTEFAGRNKNFTLRSPLVTIPMYQYLLLDVLAFTIIFLVTVFYTFKYLFKLLLTLLSSKSNDRQKNKVKTK